MGGSSGGHGVGLHLILVADRHVLLGLRRNTGFADGWWHLPGGGLDPGESVSEGAIREAREELGIEIDPADLAFAHLNHHLDEDGIARVGVFFTATRWLGEPVNAEPDKCAKIAWFPLDDLPDDIVDYGLAGIRHHTGGNHFGTHGWDRRTPAK